MNINIDNYTVNTDSNGNVWITEAKVSDKTGKTYETRVSGYCRDFKSAVKSMFEREVYSSDTENLQEAIKDIDKALQTALQVIDSKKKTK